MINPECRTSLMDTEAMQLLHDDIDRIHRECPLPVRKSNLKELEQKKEEIDKKIAKRGICPILEEQRQRIEISIKLMRLFLHGVNLGKRS